MENGTIMSAQQPPQQQPRPESHRVTGSDGSLGEPYLQQVINERNLLRSQNDQLWKIIEKQKSVINNLQKDNHRIASERDKLIAKLNSSRSEDEVLSSEKNGSESKTPVESNNLININNNDSAVSNLQSNNMDNNKSSRDSTQSSVRQLPSNYNQSKHSFPQLSLSDKEISSNTNNLEPKPQSQRQDSTNSVLSDVSNVSTNSSVSGLLTAYDGSNSRVISNDDSNNTNLNQRQETEINQSQNDFNPPMNENVLPPKSVQRQLSLLNDKRTSSPQEIQNSQNSPLNYFENFDSSASLNIPSPTISTKSSESGSLSSNGDASIRKRNSTIQPNEDENDALDQFPHPPLSPQSPRSPRSKERKIPEPIQSSSIIPPRSPRSPRSPGLPSSPRPPRSPSHDSEFDSSNNNNVVNQDNVNQDNVNLPKILPVAAVATLDKNLPVRSQSLPSHEQPSISVSGNNNSEEDQIKSKRDSLTHNNSDSNLSGAYLAPKESKQLRSSKSFTHVQPGPRARVSAMPPPRGGQYPELHFPGSNSNTLLIPGQNNRHSVFMTQGHRDNPVHQHRKNKMSLPDATIVTNPSYGQSPQPPPPPPQQMTQQIPGFVQQQQQQQQQMPPLPPRPEKQQSLSLDVASGIAVKVIGSNKKTNDKGKEVLAFVILVGQARILDGTIVGIEKELWRVEKLYSDFLALDSKLKQRQNKGTANKIGKLPDKNLFHNNAPSKVDQRKIALEQYLQHIIALPLKDPKDLCEFLSTNMIDQEEKDYQQSGFKEGYLTKKGKNFGGWKSRFFVLNSPVLEYYESKGGNHLGSIRLTHAQIGRQQSNVNNETEKDSENSYRHAFLILEPKSGSKNTTHTKHVLCAESDAERDEWVESLLQYVGEEEREIKKHSKKKFSKDSIAKVNAQPISQLGKTDLNTKLIATDSVIQQAQKEIRPDRRKGNNESLSSINITKSDSISHSSHHSHHHPSSSLSLSSSPSSSTNSLQQSESSDQSKNSFGGNQQQSMLSVSSNPIVKRSSMSVNREDSDRKVSPEPRDSTSSPVLGMSANNQSQHVKRDDNLHHEKRKGSRKTFFGSMFGSSNKDEKKKYQESRPDTSRIVFGVPLDQAIAVARIKEGYELPAVLYRCIEYLDAKNATEEEGIYRLNGAAATIKFLKDRFNTEGDVDLLGEGEYYDVHAVGGLLKLYLRELPTSVLTRELHAEFVNVIDLLDRRDRINELGRLVSALPLSNYTLLRTLTGHLIRVVQNADVNKMTVRNIGIVFSPTLGIPAGVFSLFMAEFDYIFFTDSNGTAAPRTMDAPPSETNENERSSSEVDDNVSVDTSQPATKVGPDGDPISPTALSPITALRNRNIREDVTGRSNRNSMHYMDGAPENVVGLERKLTVSKSLKRDDSSDEEEVNDLALQADDDDAESSSADESTSSPPNSSIRSTPVSAPVSPRLPAPNGFPRPNSPSGLHVEFADNDTVPEMDSLESQRLRRLTVRNFTERDSMYEVFSENQKILDALNEGVSQNNNQNLNITNNSS